MHRLNFSYLEAVDRPERSHPGLDQQDRTDSLTLLSLESDGVGILHPLDMGGIVDCLRPHPFQRRLDVNRDKILHIAGLWSPAERMGADGRPTWLNRVLGIRRACRIQSYCWILKPIGMAGWS